MKQGERQHAHLRDADLAVFRTRVCEHHRNGHCPNSDRCAHSHCQTWQRRNPMEYTYSSKLCPEIEFVKENNKMTLMRRCGRGRGCSFAHSKEEELYHPSVYKTKMCSAHPHCTRYYCPFAHSVEELNKRTAPLQRQKDIPSPLASPTIADHPPAGNPRFQSDSCHGEMMAILQNAVLDGPEASPTLDNEVLVNALLSSLAGVSVLDQSVQKQQMGAVSSSRHENKSNESAGSGNWRNENSTTPESSPVSRNSSWNVQQTASQGATNQPPIFCPASPVSTSSTSASSVPSPVLACLSPIGKTSPGPGQPQQNSSLLNNHNSIDILNAPSATLPSKAADTTNLFESFNDVHAWATIVSGAKELALLESVDTSDLSSSSNYPVSKSDHQSNEEKLLAAAFQTIAGAGGNSSNNMFGRPTSSTNIDSNNTSSFNFSRNSASADFGSTDGNVNWEVFDGRGPQESLLEESNGRNFQVDKINCIEQINSKSTATSFEEDDSMNAGVNEDEFRAAITTVTSLFNGDRNSKFYREIYQALQQTASGVKKNASGSTNSPGPEKHGSAKGRCSGGSFSTVASGSRYCSESSNRTVSHQTSMATTVASPSELSPSNSMFLDNELSAGDDLNTWGNILASLSNSQEYGGDGGVNESNNNNISSPLGPPVFSMPPPPPPPDSLFSSTVGARSASFTGSTYRYDGRNRSSLSPTAPVWRGGVGVGGGETLMYRNKFNEQRTASGTAASRQRRGPTEYASSLFSSSIRHQPHTNPYSQHTKQNGYENGLISPQYSPKSGNSYNALFSPPSSGHRRPFTQNHTGMANGEHQFNDYHHPIPRLSYDSRRELIGPNTSSNINNDSMDQWSKSQNYGSTATEPIGSNSSNQFAWRAVY